jgi:hypothetical protein
MKAAMSRGSLGTVVSTRAVRFSPPLGAESMPVAFIGAIVGLPSFEKTQNGLRASRRACSKDKPMSARRWSSPANSPNAYRCRLSSIQTSIVVESLVRRDGIRRASFESVVLPILAAGVADIFSVPRFPTTLQEAAVGRELTANRIASKAWFLYLA